MLTAKLDGKFFFHDEQYAGYFVVKFEHYVKRKSASMLHNFPKGCKIYLKEIKLAFWRDL
jgi:hypothetical protein